MSYSRNSSRGSVRCSDIESDDDYDLVNLESVALSSIAKYVRDRDIPTRACQKMMTGVGIAFSFRVSTVAIES